jgi:hypothetical protein
MVLAIVVLGVLELASFGTVLAIAHALPQADAVSRSPAETRTECVPYWMVPTNIPCPPR